MGIRLEVGKKYRVRDPERTGIKWVRVDVIRPEEMAYPVALTAAYVSGEFSHGSCTRRGYHYKAYMDNDMDLVAEYQEPKLQLGSEHVGRKVRLRNGSVSVLSLYSTKDENWPIRVGTLAHKADGSYTPSGVESEYDIVEVLP